MNVYVRELARSLGDLGVAVDVFTRSHGGDHGAVEAISPMARVVHLPAGDADAPLEDAFGELPAFLEALRNYQRASGSEYRVVHSHYWLSGWAGQAFAREQQIPHVVTFHTLALLKLQSRAGEVEPEARREVEKELMASSQSVMAFSDHERDAMVQLYGADPRRIEVTPCGVDLSLFRPLDQKQARDRLGLNGENVFLYVGRLEPLKGLDLLLQIAAQLDTCQKVLVLVVGGDANDGRDTDRLRNMAKSLKVEDLVHFVGRVDQRDLPVYYSAADVCIVPSYYESFGLAALESMACGTPVVAARVGGLSSVVQHGRTGYLKPWRCPESFANSLEMIIFSDTLQQSMGLAARKRAQEMGWEQVAGRIRRLYETLTSTALASGDGA